MAINEVKKIKQVNGKENEKRRRFSWVAAEAGTDEVTWKLRSDSWQGRTCPRRMAVALGSDEEV